MLNHLKQFVKPEKYKKYAIVFAIIFWISLVFSFLIYPNLIKFILKSQLKLSGGLVRKMYLNIPFPLSFKIYIFNITNKEEVQAGGKPHFQQIGPYVFHEFKRKIDPVDNKTEDSLEFTLINKWIFKPKLSKGLTGDEMVTTFHPVIVSIALSVNVDRQPMLPLASNAINHIFHNPVDPFWTGRAMDLLFDGIPIDCSSTDFNAKAVCSVFESGESQAIQPVDDDTFKFSFFGGYNDTDSGRFKVLRGKKSKKDLGRIIQVDELDEMDTYAEDYCNEYRGTDGLIFPPFMNRKDLVWSHERGACLSLGLRPIKKTRYRGIAAYRYTTDFGDIASNETLQCYCRSEEHCPIKGTFDLFSCIGVPIIVSLPHFHLADPAILDNIGSGVKPRAKDHEIFVDFETLSGTPLAAAKRVQINLELVSIPQISILKDVREMLFPILWFEEGLKMNKKFTFLFYMLYISQIFNRLIKMSLIITGPCALLFGVAHGMIEQKEAAGTKNVRQIKQFIEDTVDEKKKNEKI